MNILWMILVGGAIIGIQAAIFGRYGIRRLRYTRKFSSRELFAGESLEMIEELENHKWLPVPWLRVESRMPPSLLFGAQSNLQIEGDRYHRSVFFLRPYERIVRRHKVTANARGVFDMSSVVMTGGDLFTISKNSTEQRVDTHLTVYPRLLRPEKMPFPSSRFQGELPVRRWIQPDPFLYSGIREYRPGDARRDVHWRASARMGALQVIQRDYTASPRLLVLINVQIEEHQWNKLNEEELSVIERGISMAATLLLHAIDNGVEAGLGCNGCAEENGDTILLPPAASARQRDLLLDTLARLRLERIRSFHTYLDELPDQAGMDYVFVTAYHSELLEEKAMQLRARGNSVMILPISPADGREATDHEMGA